MAACSVYGPIGPRVVWESEEAVQRFGGVLMPILREIGVTEEPEIYPAHAFVAPDA
jgi:hypothetical protein